MRRGVRASPGADLPLQHVRELCRFESPASHLDQRPDDPANHVPQERVRRDLEPDQIAVLPPVCPLDSPDVVRPSGSCASPPAKLAKSCVPMQPSAAASSIAVDVQPVGDVPAPAAQPEVRQTIVPDQVAIVAAKRGSSCVEVGAASRPPRRPARPRADSALAARTISAGASRPLRREADHLAAGVHASVGPASRRHPHLLAERSGERLF